MHSFHYSNEPQPKPKTPQLEIIVRNPFSFTGQDFACIALLDTGSDLTLFPYEKLDEIGLRSTGEWKQVRGSTSTWVKPYIASLFIADVFLEESVIYGWNRERSLLGRDFMNNWRIDFDAPESKFVLYLS